MKNLTPRIAEPPVRPRPAELDPDEVDALEGMARTLTTSGHYRVVRRFRPRERYHDDPSCRKKVAIFLDVETTGLDHRCDAIIELACIPFEYCPDTGRVFTLGQPLAWLEDPGCPIPEEITHLTGLTDDDVRGRRIDDARVTGLLGDVSLVIAHNAGFDRKFVEKRIPAFVDKPWACSMAEVPWSRLGCRSHKLDFVLFHACAEFFEGHRAVDDCHVGIHVLATRACTNEIPMLLLLQSARTPTVRIWARNAPIELKDRLKARRYQWKPGAARGEGCWYLDVPEPKADAECAWLREHIYAGQPGWQCERYTAARRYSARL